MRGLRNAINHFRYIKANSLLVGTFFGIGLLSFGALGLLQHDPAHALTRDCDDNAIIRCGIDNADEFRQKYDENAPGDLPAIYGHYWIPRDIQVVEGQAFKDNTVRVNGRIVADNAQSIGRQQLNGEHPISIAGKTYYEGPNATSFASDGLPTLVALDAQGNFKYAIIKGCGNPIYAHPVAPPPAPEQPKYTCDSLNVQNLSLTQKRFTVAASASGGAQIVGYTFNFGDNSSQDTTNTTIDHTYSQPGTYTVVATAKVKVGDQTQTASGPNCTQQFTIKQPAAVDCTALTAMQIGDNKYSFTIQETHTNATYQGATLTYGDGKSDQITGLTATHQYAQAGNYTITATLKFNVDGAVKEATCQAQITSQPCQYNASLPANSPQCVPPVTPPATPTTPELPKTGAEDMILGSVGFGSMVVSASLYISSRRDFLSALLGR